MQMDQVERDARAVIELLAKENNATAADTVSVVLAAYTKGRKDGIEAAARYLETADTVLHHGTGWAVKVREYAEKANARNKGDNNGY